MRITGISASGWVLSVDGLTLQGNFDGAGNGRVCGLGNGQEVTISVVNANGGVVPGGAGVSARGSAILFGQWR